MSFKWVIVLFINVQCVIKVELSEYHMKFYLSNIIISYLITCQLGSCER